MSPVDPPDLGRFYDQWAANRAGNQLEQEYVRLADAWKWATLRPLITKFVPHPASILEFGCGSGEMLELAHASFPQAALYGIDLSERMLEMARARLPGAQFLAGDDRALATLSLQVDVGLAVDILEHLTDPIPAVHALGARATYVAFKIPLERKVLRLGLPRAERRGIDHPAGHLHFWTLRDSRALLARAGFELLAETCADPPESIRYHPGTIGEGEDAAQVHDPLRALRRIHRSFDLALEKASCAHAPGIHRLFYGSNHFAIGRLRV